MDTGLTIYTYDQLREIYYWPALAERPYTVGIAVNDTQHKIEAYIHSHQTQKTYSVDNNGRYPKLTGIPRKIENAMLSATKPKEINQFFQTAYPFAMYAAANDSYSLYIYSEEANLESSSDEETAYQSDQDGLEDAVLHHVDLGNPAKKAKKKTYGTCDVAKDDECDHTPEESITGKKKAAAVITKGCCSCLIL